MKDYLKDKSIRHEFSVPYTPQQNGAAERAIRTVYESANAFTKWHSSISAGESSTNDSWGTQSSVLRTS
jgi:heme-degrading monooxygenase HmoA